MIVLVEWNDAYFVQFIMPPEAVKDIEPYMVQSVGWVIERNKKEIRLACSQINDGRVRDILVVPMALVRKVKRLR